MSNTTIIKVNVTADHIKKGIKTDCQKCPIALALKDVTNKEWDVLDEAIYLAADTNYEIPLPLNAQAFILDFDGGILKLSPFEFEIEIDDYILGENK